MRIAYTSANGRSKTDLLLFDVADRLNTLGLRTCGVVQINSGPVHPAACDMDVKVLPDGPMFRISQSLGPNARGCRLDPSALEASVAEVSARLASGADVLIVNKFGKHEASGRGFREAISEAVALEIPVIVGLNTTNLEAFLDFAGDLAVSVAPDPEVLVAWVETERHTAAL